MAVTLAQLPLDLSVAWVPKTVTTDAPRYIPHTEWSLAVALVAPAPVRVAVFVTEGGRTSWGLHPGEPTPGVELRAWFTPYDWQQSDEMQVGFGLQRTTVVGARLKNDARDVVKLSAPTTAVTGHVIEVARLPEHGIRLALLAVADDDTDQQRMNRWRIKPHFSDVLPEPLAGLTSGQQTGTTSS